MRTHAFSDVFVFQRYEVDPDTGKMTLRAGDDLGPDYVLETVRAERLQVLTQTRISRLLEIRRRHEGDLHPRSPTAMVPKDKADDRQGPAGLPGEIPAAPPMRRLAGLFLGGQPGLRVHPLALERGGGALRGLFRDPARSRLGT